MVNILRLSILTIYFCFILTLFYPHYTSALQRISYSSSCNDIQIGLCQITFILNSNTTETISQAIDWRTSIASITSEVGQCSFNDSGLVLEPLQPTSNVQCTFNLISGTSILSIQLDSTHNNQILPTISFSQYQINFKPTNTICQDQQANGICTGILSFGTDILPFTIETTSIITITRCYKTDGVVNGIQTPITINLSHPPPNESHISIFTFSTTETLSSSRVECIINTTKDAYSPYFYLSKNNNKLFISNAIIYSTTEVRLLPLCTQANNALCFVAFHIDKRIPTNSLTIVPQSYFYKSLDQNHLIPTEVLCQQSPVALINVLPTNKVLCAPYRKTITTPTSFNITHPIPTPFTANLYTTPRDIVTFRLNGDFFNGRTIQVANQATVFSKPIMNPTWNIPLCENNTSPTCLAIFTSLYQGPAVTIALERAPFNGIDFVYCLPDQNSQVLMKMTDAHVITIEQGGQLVRLANLTIPHTCFVGYSKGFQFDWNYTVNDKIKLVSYAESFGGSRWIQNQFLPTTHLDMLDATNVKYNTIPLQYTAKDDCIDENNSFCTIDFTVKWVQGQVMNYMRSFDVYLPNVDVESTVQFNSIGFSTKGFLTNTIDFNYLVLDQSTNIPQQQTTKDIFFRIEIKNRPDFPSYLIQGQNGQGIYTDDTYTHTITIQYRKNLLKEITASPILLGYNNIPFPLPYNITTATYQPTSFTTPYTTYFRPVTSITTIDSCSNPTNANCMLIVTRRSNQDRYVYVASDSLVGVVDFTFNPGIISPLNYLHIPPIHPNTSIQPPPQLIVRVDVALIDSTYLASDVIYIPLTKTFGTNSKPNVTIFDLNFDQQGNVITLGEYEYNGQTIQIASVKHSYNFGLNLIYNSDLIPQFGTDCTSVLSSYCTITYTTDSNILVNALQPVTIVKHRIPKWSETISLTSPATTPEQQQALITGRLSRDWRPPAEGAVVKELLSPIVAHNGYTTQYQYYVKSEAAQTNTVIPQMLPLYYAMWAASGFDDDVLAANPIWIEQPARTPTDPVPIVNKGQILIFAELENDTNGDSYIVLKAALNPVITLINPALPNPIQLSNINQTISIITGVLAPTNLPPGTPLTTITQKGTKLQFTVKLGLWYSQPSPRIFFRHKVVYNMNTTKPERLSPITVPSIHYAPISIQQSDDCLHSYKTGRIQCTLRGFINGSVQYPVNSFTYLAFPKLPSNPILPSGAYRVWTTPTTPEEENERDVATELVGIFHIYRDQNFCACFVEENYRRKPTALYLMFVDPNYNTPLSLSILPPQIITPRFTPAYMNIPYQLENIQTELLPLLSSQTALVSMAIPPYTAVGGSQSLFLYVPYIVTGQLLKVHSNQTSFHADDLHNGHILLQYSFLADIMGDIAIYTNFGHNIPIPCFSFSDVTLNYYNPSITSQDWTNIITEIGTIVNNTLSNGNTTTPPPKVTQTTIPISILPTEYNSIPIIGWFYPNREYDTYMTLTSTTTENILGVDTTLFLNTTQCYTYMPLSTLFPTIMDAITHSFTVRTVTLQEFWNNPTLPSSNVTIPVDVSFDISYPKYLPTAQISKPISDPNFNGNNGNDAMKFTMNGIIVVILSIITFLLF